MRNLKGRKHGELREVLTKEFLTREHFQNKKTLSQISREVGCTHKAVRYYMDRYKMETQIYDIFHPFLKDHQNWKGYGDISMSYWGNVRTGARNRNIPFDIDIKDAWSLYLKQQKRCALSGRRIGFEMPKMNSASLDRIDSTKPYVLSNVQWVHKDLNYAKQSMATKDFIRLCQEVSEYAKR